MYFILFSKNGISYNTNDNYKSFISIKAEKSNKSFANITIEYKYKHDHVVKTLEKNIISSFVYSIVNHHHCSNSNLWEKLKHLKNIDDFIYGFICYISLFFLYEQTNFMSLLPFNFEVPCTLHRGDCCDAQIIKYINKAFSGMLKSYENKLVYHYINLINNFSTTYCKLFHAGPIMDTYYTSKLDTDLTRLTTFENTTDNTVYDTTVYEEKEICSTCDQTIYDGTVYEEKEICSTCDQTIYDDTIYEEKEICSTCGETLDETLDSTFSNSYDATEESTLMFDNNIIELKFERSSNFICTNLTEADKMYIKQLIKEEVQKQLRSYQSY